MKKVIIASLLFFVLVRVGNAQDENILADETTGIESKTAYKVTSTNYFIPDAVIEKYGEKVKSYTVKNKADRHGKYREVVFYFPLEMKKEVDQFIVNLKRPKDDTKDTSRKGSR